VIATRAVWGGMRERGYGRIVMTTSSSGLYGNFGQSNYGAAKMALVGLMNTLAIEGAKHDIRVNALSPTAATRMTQGLVPEAALALMQPETVTPALIYLASRNAPQRTILAAGAGGYAAALISETEGIWLAPDDQTPEAIAAAMPALTDASTGRVLTQGAEQTIKFLSKAAEGMGVRL
jgi:NAD(P)-dependent dehydrogenase (short-subunit alcohol dehydrogenase family)